MHPPQGHQFDVECVRPRTLDYVWSRACYGECANSSSIPSPVPTIQSIAQAYVACDPPPPVMSETRLDHGGSGRSSWRRSHGAAVAQSGMRGTTTVVRFIRRRPANLIAARLAAVGHRDRPSQQPTPTSNCLRRLPHHTAFPLETPRTLASMPFRRTALPQQGIARGERPATLFTNNEAYKASETPDIGDCLSRHGSIATKTTYVFATTQIVCKCKLARNSGTTHNTC